MAEAEQDGTSTNVLLRICKNLHKPKLVYVLDSYPNFGDIVVHTVPDEIQQMAEKYYSAGSGEGCSYDLVPKSGSPFCCCLQAEDHPTYHIAMFSPTQVVSWQLK